MSTRTPLLNPAPRRLVTLFVLLGSFIAAGCGMNVSPMASAAGVSSSPKGTSYLVFAPRGLQPAGKPATIPDQGVSVSRVVGSRGGRLIISDRSDLKTHHKKGLLGLLRAELKVPSHALQDRVEITMTIYGNLLSQLMAAFQPGGLVFERDAVLSFSMSADRVDVPLDDLTVYHIDDSGHVEQARILSIRTYGKRPGGGYDWLVMKIAVPGFSRYGLRGSL